MLWARDIAPRGVSADACVALPWRGNLEPRGCMLLAMLHAVALYMADQREDRMHRGRLATRTNDHVVRAGRERMITWVRTRIDNYPLNEVVAMHDQRGGPEPDESLPNV